MNRFWRIRELLPKQSYIKDHKDSLQGRNSQLNSIRWFKYVRHEDRANYERDGWIFAAELGPTHGYYSVLMEKIEITDDHTEKERHGAANTRPDARDTPSG